FTLYALLRVHKFITNSDYLRENFTQELEYLKPKFALYWYAPANSRHQIGMWIPYLKKLKIPFIIIVRTKHGYKDAKKVADGVPVFLVPSLSDLDIVYVSSLTTVLY